MDELYRLRAGHNPGQHAAGLSVDRGRAVRGRDGAFESTKLRALDASQGGRAEPARRGAGEETERQGGGAAAPASESMQAAGKRKQVFFAGGKIEMG